MDKDSLLIGSQSVSLIFFLPVTRSKPPQHIPQGNRGTRAERRNESRDAQEILTRRK
jgi:hypothetical protein